MTKKQWRARNRSDLIIEVWEALDCDSVGTRELTEIQKAVRERFGASAVDSPASIARTLADEGAALRHPEVLEADTSWRQNKVAHIQLIEVDISSLETVEGAIRKLDSLTGEFQSKNDRRGLESARVAALTARQQALSIAKSPKLGSRTRAEKREIVRWLTIWLQSPEMFRDWLDLRKRSAEFRRRFTLKAH